MAIIIAREIKDRVAVGDDKFYMTQLPDGRVQLIPAPDSVAEPGTDINKSLLQLMEDRIALLMNRVFDNITANPFTIPFTSLNGLTVTGVWNSASSRIEC